MRFDGHRLNSARCSLAFDKPAAIAPPFQADRLRFCTGFNNRIWWAERTGRQLWYGDLHSPGGSLYPFFIGAPAEDDSDIAALALQTALNWQQQAQALGANQGYHRLHAFNSMRGPINIAGLGPMGRALSPMDLPGIWDGVGGQAPALGSKPGNQPLAGSVTAALMGGAGGPAVGPATAGPGTAGPAVTPQPRAAAPAAGGRGVGGLIGSVEDATFGRGRAPLDPVYQQQEDQLRTRLANQARSVWRRSGVKPHEQRGMGRRGESVVRTQLRRGVQQGVVPE